MVRDGDRRGGGRHLEQVDRARAFDLGVDIAEGRAVGAEAAAASVLEEVEAMDTVAERDRQRLHEVSVAQRALAAQAKELQRRVLSDADEMVAALPPADDVVM